MLKTRFPSWAGGCRCFSCRIISRVMVGSESRRGIRRLRFSLLSQTRLEYEQPLTHALDKTQEEGDYPFLPKIHKSNLIVHDGHCRNSVETGFLRHLTS